MLHAVVHNSTYWQVLLVKVVKVVKVVKGAAQQYHAMLGWMAL